MLGVVIVSYGNLAHSYLEVAEEMIGKQVTFIANLAPRKMMGMESQGMILMAEGRDGKLRLIQPTDEVSPGSKVS